MTAFGSRIMAIFDSMSDLHTFNNVCEVLQAWLGRVFHITPSAKLNICRVHVNVSIHPVSVFISFTFLRSLSKQMGMTVDHLWFILSKHFSLMQLHIPNTFWYVACAAKSLICSPFSGRLMISKLQISKHCGRLRILPLCAHVCVSTFEKWKWNLYDMCHMYCLVWLYLTIAWTVM